jgi:hypothetical protein
MNTARGLIVRAAYRMMGALAATNAASALAAVRPKQRWRRRARCFDAARYSAASPD